MEIKAFREVFDLFKTASDETIESLISVGVKHEYPKDRTLIMEDTRGNAVYLIVSGWVKVQGLYGENSITLAILGSGDLFGEMAVIDESTRSSDVISISDVQLLSISGKNFTQCLFNDSQLHHSMLQILAQRLRHANMRCKVRHQPPGVKLAKNLVELAQNYGKRTKRGIEIFNIPHSDLAELCEIRIEETKKIIEKLENKGWVEIDAKNQVLCLRNLKVLISLANKR